MSITWAELTMQGRMWNYGLLIILWGLG